MLPSIEQLLILQDRDRHLRTVSSVQPIWRAMAAFAMPRSASNTMFERSTSRMDAVLLRAMAMRVGLSSSGMTTAVASRRGIANKDQPGSRSATPYELPACSTSTADD